MSSPVYSTGASKDQGSPLTAMDKAKRAKKPLASVPLGWPIVSILLFLAVIGLCTGGVGLVDLAAATGITRRLWGLTLGVAGAAMVYSSVLLLTNRSMTTEQQLRRSRAGLVMLLAGALIGASFLAATLFELAYGLRIRIILFLAVLTLMLSIFVGAVLFLNPWRELSSRLVDKGFLGFRGPSLAVLAAVGGLGALASVLQVAHGALYLPSSSAPEITVRAKLTDVGIKENLVSVHGSITLRNEGKTRVRFLGTYYEITGSSVSPRHQPPCHKTFHAPLETGAGPVSRYSQYAGLHDVTLIQFGSIVIDGGWFEPSEESTTRLVAYFPKGKFDLIRLTTDIATVKADDLEVDESSPEGPRSDVLRSSQLKDLDGDTTVVTTSWPVQELSLFRRLTRSDRQLHNARVTGGPPLDDKEPAYNFYPWMLIFIGHRGHFEEEAASLIGSDEPLETVFGRSPEPGKYEWFWTGSISELSLWQPKGSGKKEPAKHTAPGTSHSLRMPDVCKKEALGGRCFLTSCRCSAR
jgi:hypothetical protein